MRLRRSRAECVQLERRHVKGKLVAKYADWFGKVRRHLEDVQKATEVALMLSQISGTLECLKVMWDEKGVVIPAEDFKRLESNLASWTTKFDTLDVIELEEADLCMTSVSEELSLTSMPAQDISNENILEINQFGLNANVVTPVDATSFQTPTSPVEGGQEHTPQTEPAPYAVFYILMSFVFCLVLFFFSFFVSFSPMG